MSKFVAALGSVLFSSVANSLEHYIVSEDPIQLQHNRPQVEQLVCGSCLAYNDDTEVCLNYGANLKTGWNWY
jgi:hypothetical protein